MPKNFDDMMNRIIEEAVEETVKEAGLEIEEAAQKVCEGVDNGQHVKEFVAMALLNLAQEVVSGSIGSFKLEWDGEQLTVDRAVKVTHPVNYIKMDVNLKDEKVETDKEE